MRWLKTIAVTFGLLLLMDLLWLGWLARDYYFEQLGDLARHEGERFAPNWVSGMLVYILIPTGLLLFVLPRLQPPCSLGKAWCWGALFGIVLYGVYDLTNHAVLDHWPVSIVILDLVWGAILCGTVSVGMKWTHYRSTQGALTQE